MIIVMDVKTSMDAIIVNEQKCMLGKTISDTRCQQFEKRCDMTVSELIEQLKEMPQDAKIVMMFMDEIRSIRYHDFGGLSDEKVVQLNSYEEK